MNPDQQYQEEVGLKKLSLTMREQNNRMTKYPLFVVQVDRKIYGAEDWCSEVERKEDFDPKLLCPKCELLNDAGEFLEDYCDDCKPGCFAWFRLEPEFDLRAGVFFTEEACEQHIKINSYHYENPRSFAVGAWRNPEMQLAMRHLCLLTGDVPNYYQ